MTRKKIIQDKKKLERTAEDSMVEVFEGKLPPNAAELEIQVLGAIMLDSMVFADIVLILKSEYFYKTAHRVIFSSMVNLNTRNEDLDALSVIEELKRMGKLDSAGGVEYILRITESIASSASAKRYARIIYEKYVLRELINIAKELLDNCFNPSSEPYAILANASKDILDTSESSKSLSISSISFILALPIRILRCFLLSDVFLRISCNNW